jgi:hypothetical protein
MGYFCADRQFCGQSIADFGIVPTTRAGGVHPIFDARLNQRDFS